MKRKVSLFLLFLVAIITVGMIFTNIRTNALSSDSFEANPIQEYNIVTLDELSE